MARKVTVVFEVHDSVTNEALHEALCLTINQGEEFEIEGAEPMIDLVGDITVTGHVDGLPDNE